MALPKVIAKTNRAQPLGNNKKVQIRYLYSSQFGLNTNTDFQRALVFQGGGSLGAYEAGAYKALYELLSERDNKIGRQEKPLFDIVAGYFYRRNECSCIGKLCKRKQEMVWVC